jgi:hypothetical protein
VVETAAHPGLFVAFDFRELILRNSALGREAVDLYKTHAKAVIEALRKHPKLLLRALRLTTTGILLAQDMLRAHFVKGRGGALKLRNETVREALEVAGELGKHAKEFGDLVSRTQAFFKQIDGMTTKQILEHLAVETPR